MPLLDEVVHVFGEKHVLVDVDTVAPEICQLEHRLCMHQKFGRGHV